MRVWEKLPTVISCCFCCFLRAGTVLIAIVSFIVGVLFAPNVSMTPGFWDLDWVLSNYNSATESAVQMILGIASIALCSFSALLFIGALCNIPVLIEIYQCGVVVYTVVVVMLYLVLVSFCFFVHANCYLAGATLLVIIVCQTLVTAYFVLVTNSLRSSLMILSQSDMMAAAV